MAPYAVTVNHISKKFKRFNSPKERLWEALHPLKKTFHREFWALKDIDFNVKPGTTLGIIGRNGSGKSTLLQIICGILKPTAGTVAVNGRISALLELGADFNPDFNGRDNVIMKGLRMGLPKAEMQKRLPDIEEFADIGDFMDQPIRTYSSGMFLRLAFATSIHVEPDILIMDEIISVGDAKFQHKCYQKLIEFQEAGKTIILVTHDTHAVVKHCDQVLLLENGIVFQQGHPKSVTDSYFELLFTGKSQQQNQDSESLSVPAKPSDRNALHSGSDRLPLESDASAKALFFKEMPKSDNCLKRTSYNKNEVRFGDQRAAIIDYLLVCKTGGEVFDPSTVYSGDRLELFVKTRFIQAVAHPMFGFSIKTVDGIVVYASNTRYYNLSLPPAGKGEISIFKFAWKFNLNAGDFFIDLGVAEKLPAKDFPLDIRYSLVHLHVKPRRKLDGMVELETECEEVKRLKREQIGE